MTTTADPTPATVDAATVAHLPYEPQSARAARHLVRKTLTEWRIPELIDAAELIVSELVGNAVDTGCKLKMTVSICRITAKTVRISVRDGSRAMPCLILDAGDSAEGGRGLALVHKLTNGRWGAQVETLGKTVHADLQIDRKTG